jgi:CRP-like cAMP-binding protein
MVFAHGATTAERRVDEQARRLEDIAHADVAEVSGVDYGEVVIILQRRRVPSG